MSDQIIECVECGRKFVWSYGEQRYYRERGLSAPKRCEECRARRKHERWGPSWWTHPLYRHSLVIFAIAAVVTVFVWWLNQELSPILSWLIAVNVVTFFAFAYDKAVSRLGSERVPETVLLALAAAGGMIGALAATWLFRHKTAKGSFQLKLLFVAVVQFVLVVAYWLIKR
jgi:uncharacterized membrane protein YsdA (DUF1294 family)